MIINQEKEEIYCIVLGVKVVDDNVVKFYIDGGEGDKEYQKQLEVKEEEIMYLFVLE